MSGDEALAVTQSIQGLPLALVEQPVSADFVASAPEPTSTDFVESAPAALSDHGPPDVFEDILLSFTSDGSQDALILLETITRNVVQRPEEERCRCLRTSNKKLAPLFELPAAMNLMQAMGWEEEAGLLMLPMDALIDKFPEYATQISKVEERCSKPCTTITGGVINRAQVTAVNPVLQKTFRTQNKTHVGPTEVERRKQCCSELRALEMERRQRVDSAEPVEEIKYAPLSEDGTPTQDGANAYHHNEGSICKWLTSCFRTCSRVVVQS